MSIVCFAGFFSFRAAILTFSHQKSKRTPTMQQRLAPNPCSSSFKGSGTAHLPLAILAKADGLLMFLEEPGLVVQTGGGGGRRAKVSPAAKD